MMTACAWDYKKLRGSRAGSSPAACGGWLCGGFCDGRRPALRLAYRRPNGNGFAVIVPESAVVENAAAVLRQHEELCNP